MKPILLIILLFAGKICFTQPTNGIDNKFCIKINPLTLFDPYGGYSYRLGAECKLHKNSAVAIEYGRYFSYNSDKLNLKINSKGYIIKPEIKLYLNKAQLSSGYFLSLEYLYKKISFDYKDSIKTGTIPVYQQQYSIFKNISAFTAKYGKLKVFQNGFIFEWHAGVGVRISNGHNTLTAQEDDGVLTGENHGDWVGAGIRAINYVLPNLEFGFKLGYTIK